jgi:hypothetical protein
MKFSSSKIKNPINAVREKLRLRKLNKKAKITGLKAASKPKEAAYMVLQTLPIVKVEKYADLDTIPLQQFILEASRQPYSTEGFTVCTAITDNCFDIGYIPNTKTFIMSD